MKNVKDQVYAALSEAFENVTDQYPHDFAKLPALQYVEEENKVYERSDREEKALVRYRIDIFDKDSTSKSALKVDDALSELGLLRTACQDVADPSGWKHKLMRYEGIIDMDSDMAYWPD